MKKVEAFIRNDQYNFIKSQTQILTNGHGTVNNSDVLLALKALAKEKVLHAFDVLSTEQEELLLRVAEVRNKEQAEVFLETIKPYVIPFKSFTEAGVKKLFPKVKKLKAPSADSIDLTSISYISWIDKGSNKKFIIAQDLSTQKLKGIQGTFKPINQKGICTLCHSYEEVGMFTAEIKGTVQGTFTQRGNYICQDSEACNQNLLTLDRLHDFMLRLSK